MSLGWRTGTRISFLLPHSFLIISPSPFSLPLYQDAERARLGILKAGKYPVDFVSAENVLMLICAV
jgi:hypothetical protein